jgi:RNase P subunit RPR2
MIKKIKYGEATCDICGHVTRFNDEKCLPEGWVFLQINGEDDRDICENCNEIIHNIIKERHKLFKENKKKGSS